MTRAVVGHRGSVACRRSNHERVGEPILEGLRMSEDATSPLRRSLTELSSFLVTEQSIDDTLTKVAALAVESVPGAMFAGLTTMADGRLTTRGFTDPVCCTIDQAQY